MRELGARHLPGAGWLALAACLLVATCVASPSAPAPSAIGSGTPGGGPTPLTSGSAISPTPSSEPTPAPTVSSPPAAASTRPTSPPGTEFVTLTDVGILLPVPSGWRTLTASEVSDPASRADLAAAYPGIGRLFEGFDAVGPRASPVFVAVDPSAAGSAEPITANLSVLISQPSVGGPLLDLAAGFICDGLTRFLGATANPTREHRQLPVGEGVRCAYDVPAVGGGSVSAVAWVIGVPSGTLLVTLAGPARVLDQVTADTVAESIAVLPSPAP